MRLFDYFFYRIYKLISFFGDGYNFPEQTAWILASTFPWLNLFTGLAIIELQVKKPVANIFIFLFFSILYLAFTYRRLIKNEKHLQILATYEKEQGNKKIIGTVLIVIYVVATIVLYLYFSEERRSMSIGNA